MNFVKKLFIGSVFVLGSIGLTACGDDSSSGTPDEVTSSASGEPLILSSVSEKSPLADGSHVIAEALPDGKGGYYLSLKGRLSTDSDEFDTEGYDGEDRVYYNIDSLQFDIGDKDGNRAPLTVPLKPGASFGKEEIVLNRVVGDIPLDQDATCGDNFKFYVTVFMSGDDPETKEFQYTARLETSFTVPCKVIESSSAAAVCTEMEIVEDVVLSNVYGSDQFTLNFSTGAADNPDVTLSIVDRVPYFEASAGVKIFMEGSQKSGLLPDPPVCLESFSEAYNGEHNPMELEDMGWYLVVTPSGTYPVLRVSFLAQDDTKGQLTITYYKKK